MNFKMTYEILFIITLICFAGCDNKVPTVSGKQIESYEQTCLKNLGISKLFINSTGVILQCENNSYIKYPREKRELHEVRLNDKLHISKKEIYKCVDLCNQNQGIATMSVEVICTKSEMGYRVTRCLEENITTECICNNKITQIYRK